MYTVIRQKRKTIGLMINDDLTVVIKAPYGTTKQEIEDVVAKHTEWIEKSILAKKERLSKIDWLNNKMISYLGNKIPIEIKHNPNKNSIKCIESRLIVETIDIYKENQIKKQVDSYYRKQAKQLFTQLTDQYCQQLGVSYKQINIRKQKTRWGSCSKNGHLSYNVKLICAPIPVIEYVVLHEVMHLKYFDHSKRFWEHVEKIMPNYKTYKTYLKEKGVYLDF